MVSKLFKLIIALAVIALAIVFAIFNKHSVELFFHDWSVTIRIAYLVIGLVLVGFLLGMLVSSIFLFQQKRENSKLNKANALQRNELQNLRSAPTDDAV